MVGGSEDWDGGGGGGGRGAGMRAVGGRLCRPPS